MIFLFFLPFGALFLSLALLRVVGTQISIVEEPSIKGAISDLNQKNDLEKLGFIRKKPQKRTD